jgi:protein TonB
MFAVFEGSSPVHWTHHRSPYFRIMLLALLAHLIAFVLTPQFNFKPYQMEPERVITVIPEPIYDVPPPPEENQMPVNVVAPIGNDADDDAVIPPNMYDNVDDLPDAAIDRSKKPDTEFYAFDEPPEPIHLEKPVYPEFSRDSGIEGTVAVRVVVDRNGKVIEAIILGSDVTAEMEKAALKAARSCLFKPGMQRGKPVPVKVMIPFEFRLSDCR